MARCSFLKQKSNRCSHVCHFSQSQAQQTKKQIKEEFEKLHQFLRDEEKARITALKMEEVEKSKMMKDRITEFDKILSHIVDKIKKLEDYIRGDEHQFLKVSVVFNLL